MQAAMCLVTGKSSPERKALPASPEPKPETKRELHLPKQQPNPVQEEVAIEVEYLEDSDEEAGDA